MFVIVILALVGGAAAQPWYGAAGYCRDLHNLCSQDSWRNECLTNREIAHLCPSTCGMCDRGYYGRGAYGYNGYAGLANYNYGAYYPPYNYGVYQYWYNGNYVYNYKHDKCYDSIEHCEQYAGAGWCAVAAEDGVAAGGTAGYVAEHCKASCGFCEGDVMTKKHWKTDDGEIEEVEEEIEEEVEEEVKEEVKEDCDDETEMVEDDDDDEAEVVADDDDDEAEVVADDDEDEAEVVADDDDEAEVVADDDDDEAEVVANDDEDDDDAEEVVIEEPKADVNPRKMRKLKQRMMRMLRQQKI